MVHKPNGGKHWALFPSTGRSARETALDVHDIRRGDFDDHGSYSILSLPVGIPLLGFYTPANHGTGRFKLRKTTIMQHPNKKRVGMMAPKGPVWSSVTKPKLNILPAELDATGYDLMMSMPWPIDTPPLYPNRLAFGYMLLQRSHGWHTSK